MSYLIFNAENIYTMNTQLVFLHYFPLDRIQAIALHFQIDLESSKDKKEMIGKLVDSDYFDFEKLGSFLYKADLFSFCQAAGLSGKGRKAELWARILEFLDEQVVPNSLQPDLKGIRFHIRNKGVHRLRNARQMLYSDALLIAHRFVDYWSYNKNQEKAVETLRKKHPGAGFEKCMQTFSYCLHAYKEAIALVRTNIYAYESARLNPDNDEGYQGLYEFELHFFEKFHLLGPKWDRWIFIHIFFWYHLK